MEDYFEYFFLIFSQIPYFLKWEYESITINIKKHEKNSNIFSSCLMIVNSKKGMQIIHEINRRPSGAVVIWKKLEKSKYILVIFFK
jgi:hypothetical protein